MSVIAYDGRLIAADRQASSSGGTTMETRKLFQVDGPKGFAIVGITRYLDAGVALVDWYRNGADPEKHPEIQKDNAQWARLIVATPGLVVCYEQTPYPIQVHSSFCAWGEGGPVAVGAMEMGADARKAVEIACKWTESCGMGVDVFNVYRQKV